MQFLYLIASQTITLFLKRKLYPYKNKRTYTETGLLLG